ncbi:peptidoglycan-associated lipoprotein Pal [Desulfobulbus alkaliphilus]|uniref:peptidoglycan-associated lipoprotein Pal n=1 Tax=Desulfobulbus alkaliphilus TaxID=869814 RepID=UPI0019622D05|nr:peptidoglycan-associated lipoprotein Pal [Desulfobulbus alkaliphilus]MBM9536777.1 peptidoglycan-associated lipoprotein Pal [Desulfobulbus alkaliphilus]
MKVFSRLLPVLVLISTIILLSGCSPKTVPPYTAIGNMPEGTALDPGFREGRITEDFGPMGEGFGPVQEGLDATGQHMGDLAFAADQQSDAYKRQHGRSSVEMLPIYFDFDQSAIRRDQLPAMEHNAAYLRDNPAAHVRIEGNTDERGTNEYNLALGERRAMIARTYFLQYGIEEHRIRTVSYGEERPLFTGQTEEDYAFNRRADFVLE